jgi:hypothetical protein
MRPRSVWPGSRGALLLPRPLRTGRETFASSGSSLRKRPSRDAASPPSLFGRGLALRRRDRQPTRLSPQGRRLLPWSPWEKFATSAAYEGCHAEPAGAPPPTRRNLHDTRLEPAKRAVWHRTLGSRTSKPFGCRHFRFAPLAGWPGSLVTDHLREVCQLSPWGDVADAQPLSAPLQRGLRLLPHPLPAAPTGRLATSLPGGQDNGLTMFRINTRAG